jgi:hypothetical protein
MWPTLAILLRWALRFVGWTRTPRTNIGGQRMCPGCQSRCTSWRRSTRSVYTGTRYVETFSLIGEGSGEANVRTGNKQDRNGSPSRHLSFMNVCASRMLRCSTSCPGKSGCCAPAVLFRQKQGALVVLPLVGFGALHHPSRATPHPQPLLASRHRDHQYLLQPVSMDLKLVLNSRGEAAKIPKVHFLRRRACF